MLAVTDTGTGMSKDVQAHVYEPFFSTKAEQGTGLGLATVYGIVKQNAGCIALESEEGRGTTFRVYLPQADASAPREIGPAAVPGSVRGEETILLVEDDPSVRAVARTILERAGYRVLAADGPGDALGAPERHPAKIHLLLTDVVMPEMHGDQLAERLVAMRPDLKVLFMSGFADGALSQRRVRIGELAFIEKPVTPEALLRKVRAVLDSVRRS